jgi:prevent-host-death family protein
MLEAVMSAKNQREAVVGVTEFKTRCLGLIDRVVRGDLGRVLLSKRGRPVAAVVPLDAEPKPLWGAMRGTVTVPDGVDPSQPTGEVWKAES